MIESVTISCSQSFTSPMNFHLVDHFLFGGSNLAQASTRIKALTGVNPVKGGCHPGKGTHNQLLGLSHGAYFEVIGPDPEQHLDRVWMDLDKKFSPSLFRWAAKCDDLEGLRNKALENGIDLGKIQYGSRKTLDGQLLEWKLTDPDVVLFDGIIPFFIDWGVEGNPSSSLPKAAEIHRFHAVHPAPEKVAEVLEILDIPLQVKKGERPGLVLMLGKGDTIFSIS